MTDDSNQKSIEEMIEEHNIRMRIITGNKKYHLSTLDLTLYLNRLEAKARSPPVIMHREYEDIRLGTVYGNESEKNPSKKNIFDYGPDD